MVSQLVSDPGHAGPMRLLSATLVFLTALVCLEDGCSVQLRGLSTNFALLVCISQIVQMLWQSGNFVDNPHTIDPTLWGGRKFNVSKHKRNTHTHRHEHTHTRTHSGKTPRFLCDEVQREFQPFLHNMAQHNTGHTHPPTLTHTHTGTHTHTHSRKLPGFFAMRCSENFNLFSKTWHNTTLDTHTRTHAHTHTLTFLHVVAVVPRLLFDGSEAGSVHARVGALRGERRVVQVRRRRRGPHRPRVDPAAAPGAPGAVRGREAVRVAPAVPGNGATEQRQRRHTTVSEREVCVCARTSACA